MRVFGDFMVKYRDRLEIIADMLNAVGNGSKKTRIMYVANLSYMLLEKYLGEAIKSGLVCFNHNSYEMTEKGRAFIERYGDFSSKYSKIKGELEKVMFEREVLERMCELPTHPVSKVCMVSNKRVNMKEVP
jgi:predicted transcriptional regulator